MKKKISVVSGTRADFGLLFPILEKLEENDAVDLQIIATGMHFSSEYGFTYREIESCGLPIHRKVEMLVSSGSSDSVCKSMGLGIIGFSDVFSADKPDVLLVLGDRFEILSAVQAALIHRIPVAHLYGGDLTEGAFDESIRHAITKMSHLHFVSNWRSKQVVEQLGEDPESIYIVGSTGIDNIKTTNFIDKDTLSADLEFRFLNQNFLITFHPETLSSVSPSEQIDTLLRSLDQFQDVGLIFTMPNADTGGSLISEKIQSFCQRRPNAQCYASLGFLRYLSIMSHVDMVIGNSSSGVYEAPSMNVPTVNIGARQDGRLFADSVICAEVEEKSIKEAIHKALNCECENIINPYGDGNAAQKVVKILEERDFRFNDTKKKFYLNSTPSK